jgi:hypothetical protein
MSLLIDPCSLCGRFDRINVKPRLWFDPDTQRYVVIPRCTDTVACHRRVKQARVTA